MEAAKDHFSLAVSLLAFIATLGAYTAVAFVGADGLDALRDVLFVLGGVLGGVAIPKVTATK